MTPIDQCRLRTLGLTQTAFAAAMSVDHVTVSRWGRDGRATPGWVAFVLRALESGVPLHPIVEARFEKGFWTYLTETEQNDVHT